MTIFTENDAVVVAIGSYQEIIRCVEKDYSEI